MEIIRSKLSLLPEKPGVYLMKDSKDQIIYVGKAKVLKNRVRSYFTGSHDAKTQALVSQITDFEYIITESEVEALVLECNLIKKHNPKYNILLRDDKSYPYLIITDELHPRIMVTRQVKKGAGKYFGPYPNASAAKEAAQLLNRLFPFRKCRQIPKRPCLYYHLDQCLGPCVENIASEAYKQVLKQANNFLRGDQKEIVRQLEDKMHNASKSLQFERAKEYRDLIEDLKILNEKQNIILTDFLDRDIIGYDFNNDELCIQVFYLRQGKLIARDTFIFPFYEEPEEALISFIVQFYSEKSSIPKEILLPSLDISLLTKLYPVSIPQKGKKRELVELAIANAKTTLHEQVILEANRHEKNTQSLEYLGQILGIPTPVKIEAFDISNTSGTNPVGGMVQFINGKPERSAYRKFKIREMSINDDTASIWQVIERRYSKLIAENAPLPDLILVDGGKGQIKAAKQALRNLDLNLPVAGIVKNDRHQTSGLINENGVLLELDKNSPSFNLLARIQNEVHRFAITFHRQQRLKNMILSELDGIPGIGPTRRKLLLQNFSSVDEIKQADLEDLQKAGLPRSAAEAVYTFFNPVKE